MKAKKVSDKVAAPVTTVSSPTGRRRRQTHEASAAQTISSDSSSSSRKRPRRRQQHIPDQSVAATTLQDLLDIDCYRHQILNQLPPRTLFNLTVVSKRWRTMIKDDEDLHSCLKPYRNPAAIFVRRITSDRRQVIFTHIPLGEVSGYGRGGPRFKRPNLDLNFVANRQKRAGVTVIHSSNGLFICSSSVKNCFYLYNPTTKQSIKIPRPMDVDFVTAMNLSFEAPDRYKIFAVCQTEGEYSLMVLEPAHTGMLWRDVEVTLPVLNTCDGILYEYGVYVDGAICWPRYLSTGLLFFNVRDEELVWLPDIPQPDSSQSKIAYFGECRGYLRMVRYGSLREGGKFDMLELSSDHTMWYTMYHIDLNLAPPFNSSLVSVHLLSLVPGDEEDEGDSSLIIHILDRVVAYSFKHKTMREVCELSLRDREMNAMRFQPWRYVHSYPETLLRPSLTAF